LHEAAARGMRARQELGEVESAFLALETAYYTAWKTSDLADHEAREKLFLAVNIIGKVRTHLKKVSDDGKLAEKDIAEIAKMGERRKVLGVV